jgi:all-trans-retinol dehydrogenase (NAD+)
VRLELWRGGHRSVRTLLVCPSAVDTGMFAGISAGNSLLARFSRFAVPMLSEVEVATSIVSAMTRGDELLIYCSTGWRGLVFPWVPAVARLLPVPVYDMLLLLAGGVHGMDTFVGRSGAKAAGKDA